MGIEQDTSFEMEGETGGEFRLRIARELKLPRVTQDHRLLRWQGRLLEDDEEDELIEQGLRYSEDLTACVKAINVRYAISEKVFKDLGDNVELMALQETGFVGRAEVFGKETGERERVFEYFYFLDEDGNNYCVEVEVDGQSLEIVAERLYDLEGMSKLDRVERFGYSINELIYSGEGSEETHISRESVVIGEGMEVLQEVTKVAIGEDWVITEMRWIGGDENEQFVVGVIGNQLRVRYRKLEDDMLYVEDDVYHRVGEVNLDEIIPLGGKKKVLEGMKPMLGLSLVIEGIDFDLERLGQLGLEDARIEEVQVGLAEIRYLGEKIEAEQLSWNAGEVLFQDELMGKNWKGLVVITEAVESEEGNLVMIVNPLSGMNVNRVFESKEVEKYRGAGEAEVETVYVRNGFSVS